MANFQLSDAFLEAIQTLIGAEKDKKLRQKLNDLHYADIAEIIEALTAEEALCNQTS